ncbi:MAG TPA: sugar ABC transporter permease [Anaerolineae bacterium]|nr:sugar ABC transporter permease [Anaerolineae bacterium]HPL26976.1 sugar ABC transporter permease [Anaerolineae bacterium]
MAVLTEKTVKEAKDHGRRRGREARHDIAQWLAALPYLAPSLIVFTVFVFYPLIRSIVLSTYATNSIGQMANFVGIKYYQRLLESPEYLNSLAVTARFVLYTVPGVLLVSLVLATLGNLRLKGIAAYRIAFALTLAISGATAAMLFQFLYHPNLGPFNYMLDLLHLPRVGWLIDPAWALFAVSVPRIWLQAGFATVVLLAGMQGISDELFEAAKIDGAGFWASWRHITFPLITPSLFFLLVVTTLNAFQTFTEVNILTKGGPVDATQVVVHEIYRSFYFNGQYGFASAQALILFVIMLVLTIIQFGVIEKRVHYA